ncbi:hypothetical protein ACJX0J_018984, partial [Zea mays]
IEIKVTNLYIHWIKVKVNTISEYLSKMEHQNSSEQVFFFHSTQPLVSLSKQIWSKTNVIMCCIHSVRPHILCLHILFYAGLLVYTLNGHQGYFIIIPCYFFTSNVPILHAFATLYKHYITFCLQRLEFIYSCF